MLLNLAPQATQEAFYFFEFHSKGRRGHRRKAGGVEKFRASVSVSRAGPEGGEESAGLEPKGLNMRWRHWRWFACCRW